MDAECAFQNTIIVVLLVLLFFSYLGINLFVFVADLVRPIFVLILSILDKVFGVFGVSFLTLIRLIADAIRDLGVFILNLFYSGVHDITGLFLPPAANTPEAMTASAANIDRAVSTMRRNRETAAPEFEPFTAASR